MHSSDSNRPGAPTFIVGVGASAGGLNALETFFSRIAVDTNMAFVVIQHLSPHFKSLMNDLLARHTSMPIQVATHGMRVAPNNVYLIPPNSDMALEGMYLQVAERQPSPALDLPIDLFLNSLANSAGTASAAIILSGTGTDGSRGVKAIRAAGGLVLVQAPESAQFDGMPRSALATGVCDCCADPAELAEVMTRLARDPESVRHKLKQPPADDRPASEFTAIFDQLQRFYEIDFSRYKKATVTRRIRRRMDFVQIDTVEEYAFFLAANSDELEALYRDLLIGVTEFFRDPECFEYLERETLPSLLREVRDGDDLRIWSAGCATGEEAYSLAIVANEAAETAGFRGRVSVFATDVHRTSLELASAGSYGVERLANVSPERLARFFRKEDDTRFRISSDLRKSVIFAPHNLAKDAPFTKIDLVACRNLLIYLEPELQDRVISTFHFALRDGGILFLGSSEAPGVAAFDLVDSRLKIFRKSPQKNPPIALPVRAVERMPKIILPASPPASRAQTIDRQLLHDYDTILARQAPGVIIDGTRQILHYFGDISRYLTVHQGRPSTDLYDLVQGDLQVAICTSLPKAERDGEKITLRNVRVQRDTGDVFVDLTVDPIWDPRSRTHHYHVYLTELREALPLASSEQAEDFETVSNQEQWISDLRNELKSTKANLQTAIEELQASNEELQSTNEELLAANEELQSTNEELHSVNEELYTVNTEFERKNLELTQVNLDHDHLLSSIQTGIIFLDRNLRIRKFNQFVSSSFKLLPQDLGRPIDHIAYHLEDGRKIIRDVQTVLQTGVSREEEVETPENAILLKRILPFRNGAGDIEGAVLTFTDVTRLKQAEREVHRMNANLELTVQERTRELERSNAELQAYAYTVSHDLQEPLRMVTTYVDLFERRCGGADGVCHEYVNVIRTGAKRMSEMLAGLLQYSRAGNDDSGMVPVRCDDILKSVLDSFALKIQSSGARVTAGPLPEVWAWDGRLNQVFQNLIDNALKYSRPDVPLEIDISVTQKDNMWVFAVRDNGIGLDMKYAERIFGVFKRLQSVAESKGEGIGLAIARRIVERHGGKIWVESALKEGSTFYFSLPATARESLLAPPQKATGTTTDHA